MSTEPLNLDEIRRRVERWTAGDDDADIWQMAEDRADLLDEVERLCAEVTRLKSPTAGSIVFTSPPAPARIPPQSVVEELYRAGWRPPGGR